jgi:hypothetical protein
MYPQIQQGGTQTHSHYGNIYSQPGLDQDVDLIPRAMAAHQPQMMNPSLQQYIGQFQQPSRVSKPQCVGDNPMANMKVLPHGDINGFIQNPMQPFRGQMQQTMDVGAAKHTQFSPSYLETLSRQQHMQRPSTEMGPVHQPSSSQHHRQLPLSGMRQPHSQRHGPIAPYQMFRTSPFLQGQQQMHPVGFNPQHLQYVPEGRTYSNAPQLATPQPQQVSRNQLNRLPRMSEQDQMKFQAHVRAEQQLELAKQASCRSKYSQMPPASNSPIPRMTTLPGGSRHGLSEETRANILRALGGKSSREVERSQRHSREDNSMMKEQRRVDMNLMMTESDKPMHDPSLEQRHEPTAQAQTDDVQPISLTQQQPQCDILKPRRSVSHLKPRVPSVHPLLAQQRPQMLDNGLMLPANPLLPLPAPETFPDYARETSYSNLSDCAQQSKYNSVHVLVGETDLSPSCA